MDQQTIEILAGRINKLERQHRRLKGWGVSVLSLITAVVIMGQAKPAKVPRVVEAEKFILRDTRGNIRAELETREDGTTILSLKDNKGATHVSLYVGVIGSGLHLGPQGEDIPNVIIAAGTALNRDSFLSISGKQGKVYASSGDDDGASFTL